MKFSLNVLVTKAAQLTNHILELQSRIKYILFSTLFCFLIAYWKSTQLVYIFVLSFTSKESGSLAINNTNAWQTNFIFTDVYEAFSSAVSVCLLACSFCVLPLMVYQSLCFFLPSWHVFERQGRCQLVLAIFLCWTQYLYAVHSIIIPRVCGFLLQFQVEKDCFSITVEPKIVSYVSWSINLLALFTLVFILTCAFYLCALHGVLDMKAWKQKRKHSVFFCLLFASLLSPPEIWSQLIFTLILFLLWECFIWLHLVLHYKQKS